MSNKIIYKLKDGVTEEDLISAGFRVNISGALKETASGTEIYIPLKTFSEFGYRVIQYDKGGTKPEDLNQKDIEDLVAQGWVEKIEVEEGNEKV